MATLTHFVKTFTSSTLWYGTGKIAFSISQWECFDWSKTLTLSVIIISVLGFSPQLLLHNTKNFRYIPRVMTPLLFSLQLIHLFHSFLSENHSDSVPVYFPVMEKQWQQNDMHMWKTWQFKINKYQAFRWILMIAFQSCSPFYRRRFQLKDL